LLGQRPLAINAANRVVGQGIVIAEEASRATTIALAVWQLMAMITAQKYLSDISKTLQAIEGRLANIERWLQRQDRDAAISYIKYMQMVRASLEKASLLQAESAAYTVKLEDVEMHCMELMRRSTEEFDNAVERLEAHETRQKTYVSDADAEQLLGLLQDCSQSSITFLLAVEARGAAAELRGALGADHELVESRLRDIDHSITAHVALAGTFDRAAERKIKNLSGPVALSGTEKRYRALCRKPLQEYCNLRKGYTGQLRESISNLQTLLDADKREQREGTTLLVEATPSGQVHRLLTTKVSDE
jgi:hypothetical protein